MTEPLAGRAGRPTRRRKVRPRIANADRTVQARTAKPTAMGRLAAGVAHW
ncbi:hypothetical protein AB0D89_32640 [Streptomyces luteogriseus]